MREGGGWDVEWKVAAAVSVKVGNGLSTRALPRTLSRTHTQRTRTCPASPPRFCEAAPPPPAVRIERHNVFIPLARHRAAYDAVHVGGAVPYSRVGALLELLKPRWDCTRVCVCVCNFMRNSFY